MKEDWEIKKLGEVCEIKPPKREAKERLRDNDLVSFLPMEDLGVMDRIIIPIKEKLLKEVAGSYTYFANNDVLLAKITPCFENGKIGVARNLKNGIGFGSSEYIVFRNKGKVSEDYLFYFLSRETFREEGRKNMTGAVGHKRISKEFIKNYKIPLPPLPEQKRIVTILDECFFAIDKAKANAEQNLKNAKEVFESYLKGVFESENWESKTISKICDEIFAGGDAPQNNYSLKPNENHQIPIYANAVKHRGLYGYTDHARVTKPCVTIAARGSGTGHTELRNEPFLPIVRLIVCIPDTTQISSDFLKYTIDNLVIQRSGSAIPQLTVPMIKEYNIPVPTLEEQKLIIEKAENLKRQKENLESIYLKKIEGYEELKKSILQKAFSGELTGGELVVAETETCDAV